MADVDHRVSRLVLAHASLSAALNLMASIHARGPRRAAIMFALGTGLPTVGELLVTGPLGLLRHRTRPRRAGVPLAIVLDWYCVIHGVYVLTERLLSHLPEDRRSKALPPVAALLGTSMDLVLDPFGLDAGLWEWTADGAYTPEVKGANDCGGVPLINYLGWLLLVAVVIFVYERTCGSAPDRRSETGRLPALLLLSHYLPAVVWATSKRKWRALIYSSAFPIALYAALKKR